MRAIQIVVVSAFALFVGLITGWFTGMLLTPTLWKLEGPLGMELAGHSGPADWLLGTFSITGAIVVWAIAYFGVLRKRSE
jgi:H+/Cl- antiporter ClcA